MTVRLRHFRTVRRLWFGGVGGVMLFFAGFAYAQRPSWRAESDSIRQVIKAAADTTVGLTTEINEWKKQGTARLSGSRQIQWALRLAALNRSYQTLIAYSDRWEAARKLSPEEFAKRYDDREEKTAAIGHLHLLATLLAADRAVYVITDSLRFAVGNSQTIKNRLNEGNRSFGIQYGVFAEMTATYFDPNRNRRTRARYLQLQAQQDFLETIREQERELYLLAVSLLQDPRLQKISRQSGLSVLFANSIAGLGAVVEPAVDLTARTSYNLSQFFGNLAGTYFFQVLSWFGIGESRGHALPDFYRYYAPPSGPSRGVHPAKVAAMAGLLRAGDILFEKTRFAITDKLIPGYFGHVAVYLESYEALRQLDVFESTTLRQAANGMTAEQIEAQVKAYAAEFAAIPEQEEWVRLSIMRRRTFAKTFNGRPLNPLLFEALYRLRYEHENVLEALRDGQAISGHEGGVTLNRFAHFLYIDDFAAVRLRQKSLSAEKYHENLARFLALALLQYGKPYDFQFDVNTLDAIVCSELVYQSFVDVDFKTGKSLASYTISPDQVAQEAGIKTVLDTLKLDPPFALLQWYSEAIPLYPTTDSSTASATASPSAPATAGATATDTVGNRAFMAMVREEYGGLTLLSAAEKENFNILCARGKIERQAESERLRRLPAADTTTAIEPERAAERRLQKFYIDLNRKIEQARAAGKSADEIAALKQRAIEEFAHAQMPASTERVKALAEDFQNWRTGSAYNPNYVDLYSGAARFLLSVFRSASVADDNGFGRGLDLQLAVTNEAPQHSLIYSQHYAFLPLHVQFFNKNGKIHQAVQGGAALARIARRYKQGDYIEMNALEWRNQAYATFYLPFTLEAGGDKGPLDAVLKLTTLGNGHYQRSFYIGEIWRLELAPFEVRNHRRAFTVANLFYGARAQFTFGKFRLYATGKLGVRLGEFAERKKQKRATDFPPLRTWTFGCELLGSTLYRPASYRLEFEVSEDQARFIQGRLQKDRQARISLRWAVNE
jgi:hypothetical protein